MQILSDMFQCQNPVSELADEIDRIIKLIKA